MNKLHECNCGKKARKQSGIRKVVASCPDCKEPLIGFNGRKYPLNLVPMDVPINQIKKWIADGFNIITEQPINND